MSYSPTNRIFLNQSTNPNRKLPVIHLAAKFESTMASAKGFKVAMVQMPVADNKSANIEKAISSVNEAVSSKNAYMVILPESFNCPYSNSHFPKYAEPIPQGETSKRLSECAKKNKIFLIGGSIPEMDEESKIYNTCTVWNPEGKLVAKHRKIHLFDMDIPGKCTFKESDVFTPGNKPTMFDMGVCKVGVAVCYDMRFYELAAIYRNEGCDMIIYPGTFDHTTGPFQWHLFLKARAVDNQVYVAGVACSANWNDSYVSWAHTMLISPFGEVVTEAELDPTILYADIELDKIRETRKQIPVSIQRRPDIYKLEYKKPE